MRKILRFLSIGLIISLFIMRPVSSLAEEHKHDGDKHSHDGDRQGHDRDRHEHGRHDRDYIGFNFNLWPDSYYYGATYYNPPVEEVLVASPSFEPVYINGATYYYNNGTYYSYNGYGYQAVVPPVTVIQQQPVTVIEPPQVDTASAPVLVGEDSFTVNIPNDKGSFTAVTLKRSGNGYVGPQGEFYPQFPSVAQLKVMYGK